MWACTYGIDRWMTAKLMGRLTATLVGRLTATLVNRLNAKLVNRLTAKLMNHLTAKLVVVKLHLTGKDGIYREKMIIPRAKRKYWPAWLES